MWTTNTLWAPQTRLNYLVVFTFGVSLPLTVKQIKIWIDTLIRKLTNFNVCGVINYKKRKLPCICDVTHSYPWNIWKSVSTPHLTSAILAKTVLFKFPPYHVLIQISVGVFVFGLICGYRSLDQKRDEIQRSWKNRTWNPKDPLVTVKALVCTRLTIPWKT